MRPKTILTIGEVAALCGVATRTASQWCDSGLLPSYRLPGSSHRRIHREHLDTFMERNGMTKPAEPVDPPPLKKRGRPRKA